MNTPILKGYFTASCYIEVGILWCLQGILLTRTSLDALLVMIGSCKWNSGSFLILRHWSQIKILDFGGVRPNHRWLARWNTILPHPDPLLEDLNHESENYQSTALKFWDTKNCQYFCAYTTCWQCLTSWIWKEFQCSLHVFFSRPKKIYTKCSQPKNQSRFHCKNAATVACLQICHLLAALPKTPSPGQHTNNRGAQLVLTWYSPIWPMSTVHHLRASKRNGSFGCCTYKRNLRTQEQG